MTLREPTVGCGALLGVWGTPADGGVLELPATQSGGIHGGTQMTPKELENYCQNIIEMGGGIAEKPTDTWYRVDVTEMRENDEGTLVPVDNND